MRWVRVWARLVGVERTVVEGVDFDDDALVVTVRPDWRERGRCGICRRRCPGYDEGEGRRRWRALDLGTTRCYLEAEAPRVECKRHGVVVAAVPWARHGSRFSRSFEDQVAWLACQCSKRAVAELMQIAWLSVGRILTRVAAEKRACFDPLEQLVRIGIDELSHRKGQRYLTVVRGPRLGPPSSGRRPAATRRRCAASSTCSGRSAAPGSSSSPPTGLAGSRRS